MPAVVIVWTLVGCAHVWGQPDAGVSSAVLASDEVLIWRPGTSDADGLRPGDVVLSMSASGTGDLLAMTEFVADWSYDGVIEADVRRGARRLERGIPINSSAELLRPDFTPSYQERFEDLIEEAERDPETEEEPRANVVDAFVEFARDLDSAGHPEVAIWLDWVALSLLPRAPWTRPLVVDLLERSERVGMAYWRYRALSLLATRSPDSSEQLADQLGGGSAATWFEDARATVQSAGWTRRSQAMRLASLYDVWRSWALSTGDLDLARSLGEEALETALEHFAGGRYEAMFSSNLAIVLLDTGDFTRADHLLRRSLEIHRQHSADLDDVPATLVNLGILARESGDLREARRLFEEALETRLAANPENLEIAGVLNNLGVVTQDQGDLAAAQSYLEQALAMRRRLDPDNLGSIAGVLNNLGNVAKDRWDLRLARTRYLESLKIREQQAPRGLRTAGALNNLGLVAWRQGDLQAARGYLTQALDIVQEKAPDGVAMGWVLQNIGGLTLEEGDVELAAELHERALEVSMRLAPEGLDVADCHENLALVAIERDELEVAADHLGRSLAIVERLAPEGLASARLSRLLGEIAMAQGDLELARTHWTRFLRINEQLAPRSPDVAEALRLLATLSLARGESPVEARTLLEQAVEVLEANPARFGGARAREYLSAATQATYHDLVRLLVTLGDPVAAIEQVERSRSRVLAESLAQRDGMLLDQLPATLRDRAEQLHQERRDLSSQLADATAQTPIAEVERLTHALAMLRLREGALSQEILAVSPRLSTIVAPEPIVAERIAQILDDGAKLMAFSVGEDELVVLGAQKTEPAGAHAGMARTERFGLWWWGKVVEVGSKDLAAQVDTLRRLIESPSGQPEGWAVRARALAESVGDPSSVLGEADGRLFVLPDGPLHRLPINLLWSDRADGSGSSTIAPVVLPSMTLYSQRLLQESAPLESDAMRAAVGRSWLGLGDPTPSAAWPAQLGGLPASGDEVADVSARLKGGLDLVGDRASEAAVSALAPGTRVLHVAAHAVLDDRLPMESYLALAASEEADDDGLLQAWEVAEGLRLEADLVVLSGCETGGGRPRGGEGLLGLARAFLFAGAGSLVASHWEISDRSTAQLMEAFYGGLVDGLAKDEALARAQVELASRASTSHPHHWMAFQVIGDPRPISGLEAKQGWLRGAWPLAAGLFGIAIGVAWWSSKPRGPVRP